MSFIPLPLKYFNLFLLCLSGWFLPSAQAQDDDWSTEEDPSSELMDCWNDQYLPDFNVEQSLESLEKKLMKNRFLVNSNVESYQKLFKLVQAEKGSLDWTKISTDFYVDAKPFKNCLKEIKPDKTNKQVRRWVYLFSIYHTLSKDHITLNIKITDDSLVTINGGQTTRKNFEEMFKIEMDVFKEQEIPQEDIIFNVLYPENVDESLKNYIVGVLKKQKPQNMTLTAYSL